MARRSNKKTKATAAASATLKGRETTAPRKIEDPTTAEIIANADRSRAPKKEKFLDRRLGRSRLTWRAVLLFMLACILLDIGLYAVFELGLGKCYGILCLLN
ncbi:MAG: hypothetical protein RIM72_03930 [Alphaproteobacteria bacterium]